MQSVERRGQAAVSDSDVASPLTDDNSCRPATTRASSLSPTETVEIPSLRALNDKNGEGWAVGPSYAHLSSHDDRMHAKASVHHTPSGEQRSGSAAPLSSYSRSHGSGSPTAAPPAAGHPREVSVSLVEKVPPSTMYISPAQDPAEDDDNTFIDHGSTSAALNANRRASGKGTPGDAGSSTAASPAVLAGSPYMVKRQAAKNRPSAIATVGPLAPYTANTTGASPSSAPAPTNSKKVAGNGAGGERTRSGLSSTSTQALVPSNNAGNTPISAYSAGNLPIANTGSRTTSQLPPPLPPSLPQPQSQPRTSGGPAALGSNSPNAVRRSSNAANAGGGGADGGGARGGLTTGSPPHYSRLNANEAAPGVVYRATVPSAIRAMVMSPGEPVLWAAVGDDPLAALRFNGRELTHPKSVKDIDQVHCIAVVRIAEEPATTFKSATASPRTSEMTPKLLKSGRKKKSGRGSAGAPKQGKVRSYGGAVSGGGNDAIRSRSAGSFAAGDDETGRRKSGADGDGEEDGDVMTATGSPITFDKAGGGYTNYMWCGLSRGHVAVVNMANFEYQLIHNAHSQTVHKIWYWEAQNKVWTAGREKGVHVWDPQRRVVLKRRNIAAILEDAAYVESVDRVFAVAGDPCVRVFESSGENVTVPKGQENRIRVKSDASIIQYHPHSGLLWVGLARGSVLMNPKTMNVECSLPYTFSALLFQGNMAIMAGQDSSGREERLMVLDVSDPREASVLAYSKFPGALPLGLHIIPNTRFAVAAQDDPKQGCVVAVFVYDGTVALSSAAAGAPLSQRTEWVARGASALPSPAPPTNSILVPSPLTLSDSTTPASNPGFNTNLLNISSPPAASAAAMVDRFYLHRGAVVKTATDSRTDRKQAVEADRSNLVEAIIPDAQDIKNALKHIVKTTDEVRQSLVQQRSAEATLADFSRVLRGRQQWLLEQGTLADLPVLPADVSDRIDREYTTPEGKTIATSIEQLQLLYKDALLRQSTHKDAIFTPGIDEAAWRSERSTPLFSTREQHRPVSTFAVTPSALDGDGTVGRNLDAAGGATVGAVALPGSSGAMLQQGAERPLEGVLQQDDLMELGTGAIGTDTSMSPWSPRIASTLRWERMLHAQQLEAIQAHAERLAERSAALAEALVSIQTHVAALGQQGISLSLDMVSSESATEESVESPPLSTHQRNRWHRQHEGQPYAQAHGSSPPQLRHSAALFAKVSHSPLHKPKYVQRTAALVVKAMNEVVRLAQKCGKRGGDRDTSAGSLTVVSTAVGGDPEVSMDMGPSLTLCPPRPPSFSSPPSPPPMAPLEAQRSIKNETVLRDEYGRTFYAGDEGQPHCLITSLPGVYAMAEAELRNLRERNSEVSSFWARLQTSLLSPTRHPLSDRVTALAKASSAAPTAVSVHSIDEGLLLHLPSTASRVSPDPGGISPLHLTRLVTARLLLAVCWAECAQTILRELTAAEGMENPFLASSVHNALVPSRVADAAEAGRDARSGAGSHSPMHRQGPLQVLDYGSAQEQSVILAKVNQLSSSDALELSNTSRLRETLRAQYRVDEKDADSDGGDGEAVEEGDFALHRLPGALLWSQTALRLLYKFLVNAEARLGRGSNHHRGGTRGLRNAKARAAQEDNLGNGVGGRSAESVRRLTAVGVAMTHWALFLTGLQEDLTAVHHASQLYHTWYWRSAVWTVVDGPDQKRRTLCDAHEGTGLLTEGSASPERILTTEVPRHPSPEEPATSASIATSLTSKGKLFLLYMQYRFPPFSAVREGRAAASHVVSPAASTTDIPSSSTRAATGMPALFRPDGSNDSTSMVVAHCSAAECSRWLSDLIVRAEQLLRRVRLSLSYAHAIRAQALAELQECNDKALAHVVASLVSSSASDVNAGIPSVEERSFLSS